MLLTLALFAVGVLLAVWTVSSVISHQEEPAVTPDRLKLPTPSPNYHELFFRIWGRYGSTIEKDAANGDKEATTIVYLKNLGGKRTPPEQAVINALTCYGGQRDESLKEWAVILRRSGRKATVNIHAQGVSLSCPATRWRPGVEWSLPLWPDMDSRDAEAEALASQNAAQAIDRLTRSILEH